MWDDKWLLALLGGIIVACFVAYWLMGGGFLDSSFR